jgi:DinB superfamily
MGDPTDKPTLLAALAAGRAAWEALLERLDPHVFQEPGVEGEWSIGDILAHITPYEEYAAAYVEDMAQRGRPSAERIAALDAHHNAHLAEYRREHPGAAEHLDQLPSEQLNDLFVTEARGVGPAEALARGRQAFDLLYAAVQRIGEAELALPQAEFNGRSLLTVLPFQSYRHYEKHAAAIESWLQGRAVER